jgi:hypothetical protein
VHIACYVSFILGYWPSRRSVAITQASADSLAADPLAARNQAS